MMVSYFQETVREYAMRVIAGKAKGRKLRMVPGEGTRPITDRAKEALFSIMGNWIEETRVLDLFGGAGGVGIECLSRGAAWVDFVDLNRKAVETIRANLRIAGSNARRAWSASTALRICNAITARPTI